jgi:coenzyme F420-0:L-glutamate ligase/coenzyme F420-1:gamma-L-glutamate ligase
VEATETRMGRGPTAEELDFLRSRRVARLATTDANGAPAVVPICYAVINGDDGPAIVSALDEKPKRVPVARLRRVRHILARPEVAIVVDDYVDDWSRLAFVHVRGRARLVDPGAPGFAVAIAALRAKYPQYAAMAIDQNPLIRIDQLTASSWRGAEDEEALPARPTDLAGIIQGRRSVRAFDTRPVSPDLIRQAIAAAGWAPSPHGRQPWRFAVLERQERKTALADAMAATWQAQLALDGQDATIVQIRLAKSRERLLTAPVVVVPCLYLADLDVYPDADRQAAETTMAIQSIGAAIQNLLLTIYAAGLDAGWMCAPLFCPDVVRDTLGLDAALIPHALIPIGYPAKDPVRRDRLPLDRLIVAWA